MVCAARRNNARISAGKAQVKKTINGVQISFERIFTKKNTKFCAYLESANFTAISKHMSSTLVGSISQVHISPIEQRIEQAKLFKLRHFLRNILIYALSHRF